MNLRARGLVALASLMPGVLPPLEAATLYRCRAYDGGYFWSSEHCHQHRATIDRIATVPDGMPFKQQAELAQRQADAVRKSVEAEKREVARENRCAALQSERDAIWRRSGSGTGNVPLAQIGADRERWKQISREMAAAKCSSR